MKYGIMKKIFYKYICSFGTFIVTFFFTQSLSAKDVVITDFGAIADSTTLNTVAIQKLSTFVLRPVVEPVTVHRVFS